MGDLSRTSFINFLVQHTEVEVELEKVVQLLMQKQCTLLGGMVVKRQRDRHGVF
jgi:hypothetical protein|tara:strand:- start:311 stop:472 length:162 start_codon:yes stop_codon:yes gene_type:complete